MSGRDADPTKGPVWRRSLRSLESLMARSSRQQQRWPRRWTSRGTGRGGGRSRRWGQADLPQRLHGRIHLRGSVVCAAASDPATTQQYWHQLAGPAPGRLKTLRRRRCVAAVNSCVNCRRILRSRVLVDCVAHCRRAERVVRAQVIRCKTRRVHHRPSLS